MRRLIAVVIVGAAIFGLVISGGFPLNTTTGGGSTAGASIEPSSWPVPSLAPPPAGLSVLSCIDPSGSTAPQFAASIQEVLVSAVRGYVPPLPSKTKDGATGVPGLELTVRLVSTRPLAYGEPYVRVEIPPVGGLPPRPDMTKPGALDAGGPYLAWKKAEEQWAAAYQVALASQADAVDKLGRIDLSHAQRSGVRDCTAALMTVPSTYRNVTVAVASDLDDNEFSGTKPDFNGSPMLIIQPCPHGDALKCAGRKDAFMSWATAHGAGRATFARPEAAGAALGQLISITR